MNGGGTVTRGASAHKKTILVESTCHCGAVRLEIARAPREVTSCSCTLCRRYGALWAYYSPKEVKVAAGATDVYTHGAKQSAFHRCKQCGCVTHWSPTDETRDNMGVNARLLAPQVLARARIRHFDGLSSWEYLD
jgi:hypothetical protein